MRIWSIRKENGGTKQREEWVGVDHHGIQKMKSECLKKKKKFNDRIERRKKKDMKKNSKSLHNFPKRHLGIIIFVGKWIAQVSKALGWIPTPGSFRRSGRAETSYFH